jgi:hypothetical protein
VRTYPLPYTSYGEIVCTAGVLENGKWIRVYPIKYRSIANTELKKYQIIDVDLKKKKSDFRPETYTPRSELAEKFVVHNELKTDDNWKNRKNYVLKEVFYSFDELLELAKGPVKKSLATVKPSEIIDFSYENTDRDWKKEWQAQWSQLNLFDHLDVTNVIRKVPYKFHYRFLTQGDKNPRKLEIEDWEIGALYWNCMRQTENDEVEALKLVKQKYFDDFVNNRDLYFFVGTSYTHHIKNYPNPFMIIGLFYPPKAVESDQYSLFDNS